MKITRARIASLIGKDVAYVDKHASEALKAVAEKIQWQPSMGDIEITDAPEFPKMSSMAKSFAGAIKDAAGRFIKGDKILATKETQEARQSHCDACPFYEDTRCLKCGCLMNAKVSLAGSTCPIGKWGKEEEHAN